MHREKREECRPSTVIKPMTKEMNQRWKDQFLDDSCRNKVYKPTSPIISGRRRRTKFL
jgi:hypothetical protein